MERPEVVAGERGEIPLWENMRRRDESTLEPVGQRREVRARCARTRVNGSAEFFSPNRSS
jgi:hypothetical protein